MLLQLCCWCLNEQLFLVNINIGPPILYCHVICYAFLVLLQIELVYAICDSSCCSYELSYSSPMSPSCMPYKQWLNCSTRGVGSPSLYTSETYASLANLLQESNTTVQQSCKEPFKSYI